ncbi:LysR family transcriptional regulator [Tardiphaga sp.]|uniref:LysR family transcriptional regulator n=1 Tax=Tardiphaga sp. TaxID=1926292 RepID=UPI0037D9F97A
MSALDLNALMLFQAIAKAGSLTRAAAETHLSIPTISRRLAAFEQEIGGPLLERTSRRLSPTPLGHGMLEHAQRISAEAKAAQEFAVEIRTGLRGSLRLSVPSEFGQAWLGRAAAAFMVAHPDVVLEIQTNDGSVDFARDGCEIAIVLRELPSTRMVRKRLTSLGRGLFASPAYLRQHGTPQSLEDLLNHRCLVTDLQRDNRVWSLSQRRRQRDVEPKWHAIVANIGLLRELVVGGAGIGMLNDALCQSDLRSGRVVRLFPEWHGPPLTATAVIPGHRSISRRSRIFLDFIYRFVARSSDFTSGRPES